MTRSIRTLLTDIVDYAGLFPPAGLSMQAAAETYARHVAGEHEWMLGRFVCPASRLEELSLAAAPLMPGTHATSGYREYAAIAEAWRISALVDAQSPETLSADLDRIDAFNIRHAREENGLAGIDMVEIKVNEPGAVDDVLDELPEELFPFFEFPVAICVGSGDCRGFIAALAGNDAGAKIRTGGVVGNAFPTAEEVTAFLHACASVDVPFKATAGLHHPIRAHYPLTYEKDSPTCVMHGFLNLFLAAALAKIERPDAAATVAVLNDTDPASFRFSEEVLGWKEHMLSVAHLSAVRERFALSFGSCSFDDPVNDLKRLGLI